MGPRSAVDRYRGRVSRARPTSPLTSLTGEYSASLRAPGNLLACTRNGALSPVLRAHMTGLGGGRVRQQSKDWGHTPRRRASPRPLQPTPNRPRATLPTMEYESRGTVPSPLPGVSENSEDRTSSQWNMGAKPSREADIAGSAGNRSDVPLARSALGAAGGHKAHFLFSSLARGGLVSSGRAFISARRGTLCSLRCGVGEHRAKTDRGPSLVDVDHPNE